MRNMGYVNLGYSPTVEVGDTDSKNRNPGSRMRGQPISFEEFLQNYEETLASSLLSEAPIFDEVSDM